METEIVEERSIRRNLYRVLRKTGVTKERICLGASFIDDLNFDKIDWTIFTYYLEKIFNISIEDDELSKFGNVNDTLRYLRGELIYFSN
ncbi:acyl carrier protein [Prolixibacteraceae bacterium Z1-6]|uniref:Acyl carrier protein n=1 Tax=Draconibacterium aestuarii TaxID=2998507 RepID=A0A9X3F8Z6_9BACT|nr:acyl carrier protein [Prolixibacteraceae bacterium Z1-6]